MKRLTYILSPVFILLLSCRSETKPYLADVSGKPGEVLVVMDDNDWQGTAGNKCRDIFDEAYEMLPQYEPVFDLVHIPFGSFQQFFQLHRNILFVEISPEISEAKMVTEKDQFAASQLMITLQAPNDSSFLKLITENRDKIVVLFEEIERQRIISNNLPNIDQAKVDRIKTKHQLSLVLPKGFEMALDTTGFTWLTKETNSVIQGILIYHDPYIPGSDISAQKLIKKRDELLKQFIPGTVPGSYMTTEKEFQPLIHTYLLRGLFTVYELRGLWKMENGISMGGPFISISRLDEQNQKMTTVEGFVFAAGFEKRNYMRELEAIIFSIDWIF